MLDLGSRSSAEIFDPLHRPGTGYEGTIGQHGQMPSSRRRAERRFRLCAPSSNQRGRRARPHAPGPLQSLTRLGAPRGSSHSCSRLVACLRFDSQGSESSPASIQRFLHLVDFRSGASEKIVIVPALAESYQVAVHRVTSSQASFRVAGPPIRSRVPLAEAIMRTALHTAAACPQRSWN